MITVLRFLYAIAVFLWEQWRKDGEDVKKGGGRPYNFIVALLLVFLAVVAGYSYMYYKSTQFTIGQCEVEVKRLGGGPHNTPVMLNYPMVHRIVNLSSDADVIVTKLSELCAADPQNCSKTTLRIIERTQADNAELNRMLDAAFNNSPSPDTTQQQKVPGSK